MTEVSPKKVMLVICVAQLLSQMGAYTLPALLPTFISEWSLSNSEAGWLTGIFYGAYMISVPFLVPLTDRIDPRKIYVSSVFMTFDRTCTLSSKSHSRLLRIPTGTRFVCGLPLANGEIRSDSRKWRL